MEISDLKSAAMLFTRCKQGVSMLQRVQNFCRMQKFSLTMQKFLKPISWTFQKLWMSNVVLKNEIWQRWKKILGCKNFFSSCKNFCMMLQKSLFAAQKDRARVPNWTKICAGALWKVKVAWHGNRVSSF